MSKDLFSKHAVDYQKYRPTYPSELFQYLASLVNDHELVWDCGTGNGQGAIALADYFKQVYATDLSANQIDNAVVKPNIEYVVSAAEKVDLPDQSVSLVTAFQAFHWFDTEAFFAELKRVMQPGGVLAIIGYHRVRTGDKQIDAIADWFRYDFLWQHQCWSPEIANIYNDFADIVFPWQEISAPQFVSSFDWDMQDVLHYFNTWSAVKAYEKKYGINPVTEIVKPKLEQVWGHPEQIRNIRFPLVMRVGRFA